MALPVDDVVDAPAAFQWGAGGARMTPESIASQRKVAAALAAQGGDYSPIRSVWQGLARAAQGIVGGVDAGMTDRAEKANAADNAKMIAALLGGGAQSPAASPAATAGTVPAAVSTSPASVGASSPSPDTSGKIYSNDEPSPLDPPVGADRDAMIRTVYGEAGNEPTQGQLAVANVIRNRAVDGGYGGDTPKAVVTSPNQFEPWGNAAATARMAALDPNSPRYAAISKVVDAAYGTGGRAPDDPTEGKTMFYSPSAQAALGRPAPSWAKGEGQVIGGHTFYDDTDGAVPAAKPVQVASADPGALPVGATPTQGVLPTAAAVAPKSGLGAVNPAVLAAVTSPYASPATKQIATLLLQQQMTPKSHFTQETDKDGNVWNVDQTSGQRTVALKATDKSEKPPASVAEYEYYKNNMPAGQTAMDYGTWASKKARDAATNVTTNVDMNSGQTYDKQLAEGLGKSHAALANGVEDAQTRARDVAAMQGAIDSIQKRGGTTGGLGQQQILDLKKTINAGAAALGMDKTFDEGDLSDKEFLTKFNRSMAGAQAKSAVGSRVTNFEMSNYLKANPGLDMSVTGNQRLLGIQSQIEQRNIAVGNAIRQATAESISAGKKIDPVTVQKIITDYDAAHHVQDPITGQDLTQSYALPEFQQAGTNAGLAAQHGTNLALPAEKTIGGKTYIQQDGHWYEKN
jgi:spore germination cell wall hydrolase CwlJ-like protein